MEKISYAKGIYQGFDFLLENYKEVFIFGQGLWSPWYVGQTMKELDKKFGKDRVIDSPVSEFAVTSAALGASLCGYRPIVVHPRMDFMIFATDSLVNQAAKWRHMFGGQSNAPLTVRAIINRGGEQGAQHSQALHAWYAHIPGLRVVMPSTPSDVRDLLIASVLSDDPVLFIDDRWLYEVEEEVQEPKIIDLNEIEPKILRTGTDISLVGAGYSVEQMRQAAVILKNNYSISAEVVDLRMINPINYGVVLKSVEKTRNLLAVDGGWSSCGLAGEIIASVVEKINPRNLNTSPQRITLTDAPAPTSKVLEEIYYTTVDDICNTVLNQLGRI